MGDVFSREPARMVEQGTLDDPAAGKLQYVEAIAGPTTVGQADGIRIQCSQQFMVFEDLDSGETRYVATGVREVDINGATYRGNAAFCRQIIRDYMDEAGADLPDDAKALLEAAMQSP